MYGSPLILLIRLLHVDIHVETAFEKTIRIIAYFKHRIEKISCLHYEWEEYNRFNYKRLELEIRNGLQRQIKSKNTLHRIDWRRHFGDVY